MRPAALVLVAAGTAVAACRAGVRDDGPPVPEVPTPLVATSSPAVAAVAPAPPAACRAFLRPGVLRREVVVHAANAGMGVWLRGVRVDPLLAKGAFRGWIVRRLHPEDPCFGEIDISPGDVVHKVNGRAVEKPDEASRVFDDLRTAKELIVDYSREGRPMKLVLAIE